MKTISLKRILVILAAFFTALLFLITPTVQASADETSDIRYTDVLEDLKKDESFDETKYPAKADDYSLKVLQIGETVDRELYVYVYRPRAGEDTNNCLAKKISLSKTSETSFSSYNLTLIDNTEVFDKYRVEGFNVNGFMVRMYSISMISREAYKDIDGKADGNGILNIFGSVVQSFKDFKSYKVAQRWRASTSNGAVTYECEEEEVVIVTKKLVGFIRYPDGYLSTRMDCNSHFVAFSCDHQIDTLLKARVCYTQGVWYYTLYPRVEDWEQEGADVEKEVVLDSRETVTEEPGGISFGKVYRWKEIEKSTDFLESVNKEKSDLNMTSGAKEDIAKTDWILRFATTERHNNTYNIREERVSKVAILELTFMTKGKVYTMGVVDDYDTPDDIPDAEADPPEEDWLEWLKSMFSELWDKLTIIFKIIVLVLIAAVLLPILPWVFKLIGFVLKWAFKIAWWLFCFPWNLIAKLFGKGDGAERKNE